MVVRRVPYVVISHICLVIPWSLFIVVGRGVTGSVICLMFNLRRHICINLLVVMRRDAVC